MNELLKENSNDYEQLFAASVPDVPKGIALVVTNSDAPAPATATAADTAENGSNAHDVFMRLGHITRSLHDALRELGYDKQIEGAVSSLPDARTRLEYIAKLTGEAAERVLNSVDKAKTAQDQIGARLDTLSLAWKALMAGRGVPPPGLVRDTADFFSAAPRLTQTTQSQLTDIMMAQDFHDLTGQVIRKIVTLAQGLEEQLVKLLLEATPPARRAVVKSTVLDGPQVETEGRTDIVTNQEQVDDLLAKLGF